LLHQNENYYVDIDRTKVFELGGTLLVGGYKVVNRNAGVVEYYSPAPPEALFTSEHMNHALVNRAWEWRKQATPAADIAVN
jgi:hypothetical protein